MVGATTRIPPGRTLEKQHETYKSRRPPPPPAAGCRMQVDLHRGEQPFGDPEGLPRCFLVQFSKAVWLLLMMCWVRMELSPSLLASL